MPITPFSTPAEAPIMDTYVPIPFQEMMQAGAMTQQRYDENIAMTDELSSQLDQINALGDVAIPGIDDVVKFNDKKVIQAEYDKFDTRISELTKSIQDKSSPEYRQQVRGIISDFRRSSGPRGNMGMAMANVQEFKAFKKKLDENPQLANSPHLLMPFIKKLQAHNKRSASGEITPLDLSGAVGETVDINKKLSEALKHMGSTVLKESQLQKYGNDVTGLYGALQETGISKDRIKQTVAGLLASDREMLNDLQQQAEYFNARNPGANMTANDIAVKHADTMANIFTKQKREIKTYVDQAEVARVKKAQSKAMDREAEVSNLMSGRLVMGKKGSGVATPRELKTEVSNLKSAKTNAISVLKQRAEVYGLEVDADGKISNTVDAQGKDRYDELKVFRDSVQLLEDRLKGYRNFEKTAKETTGYTESYVKSDRYQQSIEDLIPQVESDIYNLRLQRGGPNQIESDVPSKEEYIASLDPSYIKEEATKRANSKDPRYKAYLDYLEEKSKDGTEVAGFKQLPDKVTKSLTNIFINTRQDVDAMPSALYGAGTENAGVDYKEDQDAFKGLHIARKSEDGKLDTTPYLMGLTLDPTAGGKPMLLWNVKDKDGKHAAYVKEEAPVTLINDLLAVGDINAASYIINSTLEAELGVLGDGKNQEQTINLDLTSKGKDAPTAKIYNRGTVHPDYKVTLRYDDKTKNYLPEIEDEALRLKSEASKTKDYFPKTKGDLIALLTYISKKYEISKTKQK